MCYSSTYLINITCEMIFIERSPEIRFLRFIKRHDLVKSKSNVTKVKLYLYLSKQIRMYNFNWMNLFHAYIYMYFMRKMSRALMVNSVKIRSSINKLKFHLYRIRIKVFIEFNSILSSFANKSLEIWFGFGMIYRADRGTDSRTEREKKLTERSR
jgi:hypothetical protein